MDISLNSKSDNNQLTPLVRPLAIAGCVLILGASVLLFKDKSHFFFTYLTTYTFFLTVSLGAMFFVLLQHVTSAGWSVVVRRVPEILMSSFPLLLILFLPLLFGLGELYHWTHIEDVLKDHLLQIKQPYLNITFFCIRLLLYFLVWVSISRYFLNNSVFQDESGDHNLTHNMQRASTYSMILFALTITFSAIDLIMSLTPHWYSTIFGIYIFAGAVVASLAVISLIYIYLRSRNLLKSIVTIEHFHDLGKLLYGFNIFWTYIAFSQFFLIWYANVPEETVFYALHSVGSWHTVAVLLAIGHFAIPFVLFMSKYAKRNLLIHAGVALWLLVMHFIDLYWIIMPTLYKTGINFSVFDVILFLGVACIYLAYFFRNLSRVLLFPKKDPRLKESLEFTNI